MSKGFEDLASLSGDSQLKFAVVLHLYFGHIEHQQSPYLTVVWKM
jgi:hypothetical protein